MVGSDLHSCRVNLVVPWGWRNTVRTDAHRRSTQAPMSRHRCQSSQVSWSLCGSPTGTSSHFYPMTYLIVQVKSLRIWHLNRIGDPHDLWSPWDKTPFITAHSTIFKSTNITLFWLCDEHKSELAGWMASPHSLPVWSIAIHHAGSKLGGPSIRRIHSCIYPKPAYQSMGTCNLSNCIPWLNLHVPILYFALLQKGEIPSNYSVTFSLVLRYSMHPLLGNRQFQIWLHSM